MPNTYTGVSLDIVTPGNTALVRLFDTSPRMVTGGDWPNTAVAGKRPAARKTRMYISNFIMQSFIVALIIFKFWILRLEMEYDLPVRLAIDRKLQPELAQCPLSPKSYPGISQVRVSPRSVFCIGSGDLDQR